MKTYHIFLLASFFSNENFFASTKTVKEKKISVNYVRLLGIIGGIGAYPMVSLMANYMFNQSTYTTEPSQDVIMSRLVLIMLCSSVISFEIEEIAYRLEDEETRKKIIEENDIFTCIGLIAIPIIAIANTIAKKLLNKYK
ncbi:MAG TPA: hypothetical protein VEK38_00265 [Candidatus Bathyarchaeia archaeon]|nr:hypothetical protein [Candidatus Bathyarchaeia archaeon]